MKHLLFSLAVVALAGSATHATAAALDDQRFDKPNIARDIGSAGRLRLQSQRLAKLYLQIGLGLNADAARRQLSKGSAQFEADLHDLSGYARNAKTQRTLARTGDVWEELKGLLATPYGAENMQRVNYLSDDLMVAAGKLAMQIENEANTPVARLLDLSLRQSMLAQRLAKLYLMAQAGDKSRGRLVDVEQTRKEFATTLNELSSARENSSASREALELAKTQWIFFEHAIQELNRGAAENPQHVASASERILEVLDAVSRQYTQDYSVSSSAHAAHLTGTASGTQRN